jgi:NAD(P)-dependent dehydrogenase (short-subunit alcohol dehydrogenase family)
MQQRDPNVGATPAPDVPTQQAPGVEGEMKPQADHGEESYRGAGRLEGLAAIVTGGDSGIGRAVAIAFAREGADVADRLSRGEGAGRRRGDAALGGEARGGAACCTASTCGSAPSARPSWSGRVRELGRVDVLVNNAAYQQEQQSILDISEEQLDGTFRTNIYGYIFMVQAVLPHLEEGAVILNTGSVTAFEGNAGLIDYASTKGAIHTLTKSLAQSLGEKGIRVNCVAPGPVWTPLIPATLEEEHVRKFGQDTVWGRPAQPAEIAPSYVFLASADARYYTGEVLAPTGKATSR